jgi:hypothetical protein
LKKFFYRLQERSANIMADSFTTLWTDERCKLITKHHLEGTLLNILFGGPHTSEPSFRRAGVKTDDYIYPLRVKHGILYVIACMRVKEIVSLEAYIEHNPGIFAGVERTPWPSITFDNYVKLHPEMRILAPTCTEEVVLGGEGTPIRLDVAVSPELLERLRFRSQKRERSLKHIQDGKLKSVISLQGIYRLSARSADEFARLLAG